MSEKGEKSERSRSTGLTGEQVAVLAQSLERGGSDRERSGEVSGFLVRSGAIFLQKGGQNCTSEAEIFDFWMDLEDLIADWSGEDREILIRLATGESGRSVEKAMGIHHRKIKRVRGRLGSLIRGYFGSD